jgi:predicted dehydrogenase
MVSIRDGCREYKRSLRSMTTVGLVGCGDWGKNILRDLRSLGCRVLVASPSPESRERALSLGAQQVFAENSRLPACDGYVLATPIPALAREALALLPRGKPIFSEKTLCPTMVQADRLFAAGGEGQIFVMHKWEYHPGIQTLRAIADSGRLGTLEQVRCARQGWVTSTREGDVLTLLAIHDLTIVRHILGTLPDPAFSLIRRENDLAVSLLAVLGQGPRAVLSIDARHPCQVRSVSLHGTTGSALLANAFADHILVRDSRGEEQIPFEQTMPLYEELKEFVAYLQGGPEPRCGLDQARDAARALDALRRLDQSVTQRHDADPSAVHPGSHQ